MTSGPAPSLMQPKLATEQNIFGNRLKVATKQGESSLIQMSLFVYTRRVVTRFKIHFAHCSAVLDAFL
jgi:hypothetical protein